MVDQFRKLDSRNIVRQFFKYGGAFTAALSVLSSVDSLRILAEVIGAWRLITRRIWDFVFSQIEIVIDLPFEGRQYDALTLAALALGFVVAGRMQGHRNRSDDFLSKSYGTSRYPLAISAVFFPSLFILVIFSGLAPLQFANGLWGQSLLFFSEALSRLNGFIMNQYTGAGFVILGFGAFFWIVSDILVLLKRGEFSKVASDAPAGIKSVAFATSSVAALLIVLSSIYAFGSVSFGPPLGSNDFLPVLLLYVVVIALLAISVAENWKVIFRVSLIVAAVLIIDLVVTYSSPIFEDIDHQTKNGLQI